MQKFTNEEVQEVKKGFDFDVMPPRAPRALNSATLDALGELEQSESLVVYSNEWDLAVPIRPAIANRFSRKLNRKFHVLDIRVIATGEKGWLIRRYL